MLMYNADTINYNIGILYVYVCVPLFMKTKYLYGSP